MLPTTRVAFRACVLSATLGAFAVLTASASAQTSATIAPAFVPDRPGTAGRLSMTVDFADPEAAVPAPVRSATLRFPAGLSLEVPTLSSCSPARLRAHGANGCPAQSLLGRGHALVVAQMGSQTLTESVSLWLFLAPPRNLQPAVEVLGQGYTPFDERVVLTGKMLAAEGLYGEALALSIPAIPTLKLEPDASIASLSLTIGTSAAGAQRMSTAVRVPAHCPRGGFPFAAEFTYANGTTETSKASAPCP